MIAANRREDVRPIQSVTGVRRILAIAWSAQPDHVPVPRTLMVCGYIFAFEVRVAIFDRRMILSRARVRTIAIFIDPRIGLAADRRLEIPRVRPSCEIVGDGKRICQSRSTNRGVWIDQNIHPEHRLVSGSAIHQGRREPIRGPVIGE